MDSPYDYISFEDQVHLDHTSFIDGTIAATKVLIEQKSLGKSLTDPIRQSDGSMLSPFQQAKRYITELPLSKHPRWVVTCNFESFFIYDMERPGGDPEVVWLKDLEKEVHRLDFLVKKENTNLEREKEVSVAAGNLVGKLYDALLPKYADPNSPSSLRSLNILCVRLVFCLYAEDAGVFGAHDQFHDYLAESAPHQIRKALAELFKVLDTPFDKRDPYLKDDNPRLAAFPYVNGGLFEDETIEIPPFDEQTRSLLLNEASLGFDWTPISPTIFGAIFESTLNPTTRRSGGMHYTSIENIHKLIDPLFLDELKNEFAQIMQERATKKRDSALRTFQDKLAGLTFLDPACGSGNFLTETYVSLRRLENEVLRILQRGQITMGWENLNPIKVSITQFHGIEINDFAVTVAKTALWIAESQMLKETETIVQMDIDFLPLKTNASIHEGNALHTDWNSLLNPDTSSSRHFDFIIGNPPFVGARLMSAEQKEDVANIFGPKWKNAGNLDYVSCWYKKCADLMQGTSTRAALVSTNSVCQGESVAILWKPLFEELGAHIDFAYRTFRWDSEASLKAHVHCVIVGFSCAEIAKPRMIVDGDTKTQVENINGYLIDAANVWVESRTKPLCSVPEIGIGNKPIDGGFYLFTEEEMRDFVKKEPASEKYFKPWYGAQEFINQKPRYCLWLGDCAPHQLRSMPECMKRVKAVREYRLASPSAGTVKLADKPTRFHVENMPSGNYLLVPCHSSENRTYIPIGFMQPTDLTSNACLMISGTTLYHFGVLTSSVHMAWMRVVCGRLKSDYRYSKDIVYNNFPWPDADEKAAAKIEQTAQAILDARAQYPDSSLADLYDELTMPHELRKAHQANDRAVLEAYGFAKEITEDRVVARLMELYQTMTGE